MAHQTTTDVRTDAQKTQMNEVFADLEPEFRADDGHQTVVFEDDDTVVVADHTGHEINEIADDFGLDRTALLHSMRALAEEHMSTQDAHEAFSHSDPLVFDKLDN